MVARLYGQGPSHVVCVRQRTGTALSYRESLSCITDTLWIYADNVYNTIDRRGSAIQSGQRKRHHERY
jgi:hypothetical protein